MSTTFRSLGLTLMGAVLLGTFGTQAQFRSAKVARAGNTMLPLPLLTTASFNTWTSGPFSPPLPNNFYQPKVDFATGNLPYCVTIADLDGDNKPDLVTANLNSNTISVLRNMSSTGIIDASSFAPGRDFPTGAGPASVAITDLDGDGKPDIVVANEDASTVSVFHNASAPGPITAAAFPIAVTFATGDRPYSVILSDVDGDGKADIVTANAQSNTLSVLRNTTSGSDITNSSFAAKVDFATGTNPRFVAAGDVDGDGKADLVVANELAATVSVLHNVAVSGVINASSLESKVDFTTGAHPVGVVIGDIDGDGRAELAVANFESNSISVLHNTAGAGSISAASFAPRVDFATTAQPFSLALGDVDGDGKKDISIANSVSSGLSVLHNSSTAGSIGAGSFEANLQFATGGYPLGVAIGDLDGDAVPEVVTSNGANTLSVFKTAVTVVPATRPVVSSMSPAVGMPGSTVTFTGTGFNPSPSANIVFFGGVKASVTGGSATSLTVTVPTGSFYQPPVVLNTANGLAGTAPASFLTTFINPTGTTLYGGSYKQVAELPTGAVPYAVAFADFNGDGKPDMAAVNSRDNAVSVTRNNTVPGDLSATSFSTPVSFPAGSDPRAVAVADVDGDGKPDLVVANLGSATVSVYRNTSAGGSITTSSFAAAVQFATGNQPFSVAIGDLDGDGKPDLVTANLLDGTLSLLRNTGSAGSITTASFSRTDFSTAATPRFVAIGDLDGDGKADLAVANQQSATISVWRNIATAGTLDATSFSSRADFTTLQGPQFIAIGDLNADGKPELAVACFGSKGLSVLQNTSVHGSLTTSSFAPQTPLITDGDFSNVALADVNGDGIADIIAPKIGSFAQNEVLVWRNLGQGGNLNNSSFTGVSYPVSGYLVYSAVVDLDGDGGPEMAAVSASDNRVTLLSLPVQVSPPVPTITAVSPSRAPVGSTVTISGTNFNSSEGGNIVYFGSVKATVKASTSQTLTVTVPSGYTYEPVSVLNTGTSLIAYSSQPFLTTFPNPRPFNTAYYQTRRDFPLTRQYPYGVALGDIDGDGKPDMVVANSNAGSIIARQNKFVSGRIDLNSFGPEVSFASDNPFNVVLKDLDRDGKLDVVAVNLNNSSVHVYKNTASTGIMSFASPLTFAQTKNTLSYSVAAGDVDNDGRPDIVFVNATNNVVSILKNNSAPGTLNQVSFSSKVDLPTGAYPRFVALSDIDGDGKLDILVANQNDNTLSILRNIGSTGIITTGSFAPRVNFPTGSQPAGLAVSDIDGDGKTDVAVINNGSNTVSVLRNLASPGSISVNSLSPKADFATGSQPYAITITDADGDGRPDLLVANSSSGTISALRNTATAGTVDAGSFAPKVDFTGAGYLISLAAGDLDGDGVPEILTGNASSNPTSISVLSVDASEAALPAEAPIVTAFAPVNGPAGSTITLTGDRFNADPSSNTVYFGAVKAQVTGGSTNTLMVTVPPGGTYKPLSVLNNANGLTGYSSTPFLTTFAYPNTGYSRADYPVVSAPKNIALGDLDGDGKPDIVVSNSTSPVVSVFPNAITKGIFVPGSFGPRIDLATSYWVNTVQTADIDGDGKLDIIAAGGSTVSVFRNVSVSGPLTNASFAAAVDFTVGAGPGSIAIADLDNDGRPDLAVSNSGAATLSVLHNTSMPGNITSGSFEPKVDFVSYRGGEIEASDMDGDGKPDLVQIYRTGASRYDGSVAILRNNTVTGIINVNSFSSPYVFPATLATGQLSVFDIDGDGKKDVAYSSPGDVVPVKFMKNTSTAGNFSLVNADGLVANNGTSGQAVGDLNGDGKPDLVVCDYPNNTIFGYTNKAVTGVINYQSFSYGPNMAGAAMPVAAVIGDVDGDAIPEVLVSNSDAPAISIYHINTPASATAQSGIAAHGNTVTEKPVTGLLVFPNPARDEITLLLSGLQASAGSIEILDASGKLVSRLTLTLSGSAATFVQRLSLRGQSPGTYYVKVITTSGIQVARVLLQR